LVNVGKFTNLKLTSRGKARHKAEVKRLPITTVEATLHYGTILSPTNLDTVIPNEVGLSSSTFSAIRGEPID
jgi:hypothetical protein